jgi:hypothetical protein
MHLHHTGHLRAPVLCLALALACSPESGTMPPPASSGTYSEPAAIRAVSNQSSLSTSAAVEAQGTYHFVIPADFNGGIFGVEVGNHVSFVAQRLSGGDVTGRFRYVQTAGGEDFIFSGTVTCLNVYDTPVLQRFESIPPASHNRAKWGGIIEESNDPTLPAGGYIWFQSIDNNSGPEADHPDLSTLSGFGNAAANEAFCNSAAVPNPNFGPHAVAAGNVIVR